MTKRTYFLFSYENPQSDCKPQGLVTSDYHRVFDSIESCASIFNGVLEHSYVGRVILGQESLARETMRLHCKQYGQHSALEVKDGHAWLVEPDQEAFLGRWRRVGHLEDFADKPSFDCTITQDQSIYRVEAV